MRAIGLMSGTSLDGVDGVLVDFADDGTLQVLSYASSPMPAFLHDEFLALNAPGANELHRSALASNGLVRLYAEVVHTLLETAGVAPASVACIGAHGQTVRHRPGEFDGIGYTLQLNQPALLAELTGITVCADFRSRDVAAGGQGAPLVPAFHSHFLNADQARLAVLNLGGIANLTLLDPDAPLPVRGFDCGPGNALLDHWCQLHTGQAYDADGTWGRAGQVIPALLERLLDEPFLARPLPKSTGRDLFNPEWLDAKLQDWTCARAVDVQATLSALTVQACVQALQQHFPACARLLVCGGGAYNRLLMDSLQSALAHCEVASTQASGLPPLQVEACAFAWLASRLMRGQSGNLPAVTGAAGPRLLGAIFPA